VALQRRQTEEALAESERTYRELVEASSDMIFTVDAKGNFLFANKAFHKHLGYSDKEIGAINGFELVHPDDLKTVRQQFARLLGSGNIEVMEYRYRTKDGSYINILNNVSPVLDSQGHMVALTGIAKNITERKQAEEELEKYRDHLEKLVKERTVDLEIANKQLQLELRERKQAEEALRQSEERYRTVLDEMEDSYFEVDLGGHMTFGNDSTCQNLRRPREELIGKSYKGFSAEKDFEAVYNAFNKVYRTGKPLKGLSWEVVRGDGSAGFAEATVLPLHNEAGQIIGFRGIGRDIAERKQAEEALRQSEERYRTLFETKIDGVVVIDETMKPLLANQAVADIFGFDSVEEALEVNWLDLIAPEERERVLAAITKDMFEDNLKDANEFRFMRKSGEKIWISAVGALIEYQGKPAGLVSFRDITERKQMEAEKRELEQKAQLASRLATVGQMASGVGHEINNPLTGVIGYSQLLLQKDVPDDIRSDVKAINDAAQRVANIVKKLLAFARHRKPKREYISINDTLAATIDLLAHQLETSNIKLTIRLAPDLPATVADAGQLQQVFLNLIINAETEMKLARGKGKLSIKTQAVDTTISISFKDDGPGIASENLERIFDPFFTTREVGQGTGLGLSICHEIIAEHSGTIHAQSEPGKGATFIVQLPIITEQKEPELAEPAIEQPRRVAVAKILVVDDEPVVLSLMSQVLTDQGHKVDTVDNASDALERIRSERYSLILLDIKLPGMSGIELYEHIQQIARSLARRVVFITGDVLGVDTIEFLSRTKVPCIVKPFDAEQLKKEINHILATGA